MDRTWPEHVPRAHHHKEAIEDLCLNRKIPGKKARGGQRLQFLKQYNANARTIIDTARQRKDLSMLRSSTNPI